MNKTLIQKLADEFIKCVSVAKPYCANADHRVCFQFNVIEQDADGKVHTLCAAYGDLVTLALSVSELFYQNPQLEQLVTLAKESEIKFVPNEEPNE